jgi:putative FmdB family regulatory protein
VGLDIRPNICILQYIYYRCDMRLDESTVPTYDYRCQDCGKPFDVRASMAAYSEGLTPRCPDCGSENAVRGFSAVNVLTGSHGSTYPSGGCGPSGFS